ncbi:putative transcription factor C2C2-GATA family [Helianthus annuus]|nr:putative transcription factor C2C2-GATA family [Helianthus annuus]
MFRLRVSTVLGLPYPVPKKCRSGPSRKAGRVWSRRVAFTHRVVPPAAKKQRKSPASQNGPGSSDSLSQRRCTHCQVQKTPQWRTGPLGPKTLCNACGVRFKSGRLYPEYRPACSPTFSVDVHSNSHRKVLEMRKRKEIEVEPGHNLAVQTASVQMVEPVLVV